MYDRCPCITCSIKYLLAGDIDGVIDKIFVHPSMRPTLKTTEYSIPIGRVVGSLFDLFLFNINLFPLKLVFSPIYQKFIMKFEEEY